MTEHDQALLGELLAAITDALDTGDLLGHVQAWLAVAEGRVRGAEHVPECVPASHVPACIDQRRMTAVRLAHEHGTVTSGELAAVAGVSGETARLDLASLAYEGLLLARGSCRGRRYVNRKG